MRYVAAYMLATLGGKASPNADDVKRILSSVGVESDQNKIDIVLKNLQGKNIDELIAEGLTKLSTMPSGGGGAAATSEVAADSAAKPDDKKKEEKVEKKEESEEEDDDMGFGLFD